MGYRDYIVMGRVVEVPGITTLRLMPASGPVPEFIPGQFVNAVLPRFGSEAKSYSIVSIPSEETLALTIRKKGEFSSALVSLAEGDTLSLSEPCGFFYPEDETTPRIFASGGIGITPFMSMLRDARAKKASVPTLLLRSSHTASDRPFLDELAEHERSGRCMVRNFITREGESGADALFRRIGPEDILSARETLPGGNFFLCGGINFVRGMRIMLKDAGIPEEEIFTEAFF